MPVGQAAEVVLKQLNAELPERRLFAVTHSLGGALCLHLAQHRPIARAVFLAPPMQGSMVARQLMDYKLFQWFYGPAGQEVAAEGRPWPLPDTLGDLAVIAGNRALSLDSPTGWATRLLGIMPPDRQSDGTVALSETRPDRLHHFVALATSHNGILTDLEAHKLALRFLLTGDLAER